MFTLDSRRKQGIVWSMYVRCTVKNIILLYNGASHWPKDSPLFFSACAKYQRRSCAVYNTYVYFIRLCLTILTRLDDVGTCVFKYIWFVVKCSVSSLLYFSSFPFFKSSFRFLSFLLITRLLLLSNFAYRSICYLS